jgi:AcrR family transcriptional regulator
VDATDHYRQPSGAQQAVNEEPRHNRPHETAGHEPAGDDFRRGPRRRGRALEEAIHQAVLDELAEHTFDGLSIERVAHRAGTGKSAIYRRWATKLDLVVATFAHAFPSPGPATSSGDLRTDLLQFHQRMAEALGGTLGAALLANASQHRQHPELAAALREQILAPRHRILGELLAAGAARGDVRPGALTPECIESGPALLRQHFIESGQRPSDDEIAVLVDNVLIPMFRPVQA